MQHAGYRFVATILGTAFPIAALGHPPIPLNNPDAILDLTTVQGASAASVDWRYHDAIVTQVDHRGPGPDLKATGLPNRTYDIMPRGGAKEFDDADWQRLGPTELAGRRCTGRLCFGWYRTSITLPDRVGAHAVRGCTVVLEIVLDDYAEVWVDGQLPQVLGQVGGPLAAGWNAPNRVVLTRDAQPGQKIQLAVFAANGPLSQPPENFVWIRSATLDFYSSRRWSRARVVPIEIVRRDPQLDELIADDAVLEQLADGFTFTEGPVWVPPQWAGAGYKKNDEGYLLFSDPNRNVIYRLTQDGEVSVFRTKSGYTGVDIGEYRQPGSNGLTLDSEGRLTICEHGNRRVTRLEPTGAVTVLADRFDGKRLNSPNDLIYASNGRLYFTDPPFGFPGYHDDSRRELPHFGVYCLKDGHLSLVSTDMTGPNGIALSPDEEHLYVANWDLQKKVVMRYDVQDDGSLANGTVFFDMTTAPGEEALDGVDVDRRGNLYVSGPGGVWIIAADGRLLGMLKTPELPANFAWGDEDGRSLYMAARTGICRLRTKIGGRGPGMEE